MSRDQRPGTVRIIAVSRTKTPGNRRRGDAPARAGAARPDAPARHWLVVPAWLFAAGFAIGGLVTAARDLIPVPGL